ncbi:GspH/FimT family pseudopilin [Paucibacter sp. APW11]|uniref:Type II secretion system protein H n=1 Tax=Roseateles aquae TaxID=3077235 RepID=A0ABU3P829_9BURK|nr:GspH/FimT family pseudopilin [Paucibacter sp. APW11]MDT8998720.1 GspH/FimT family pseudopilin [Paucibacter sp. APW11]
MRAQSLTGSRMAGFCAVEVCVAATIVAMLTSLALPSLKSTVTAHRAQQASQTLLTAIREARSEAIRSQSVVKLNLQSSTHGSCLVMYVENGPASAGRQPCQCSADGTATCNAAATLLRHQWLPSTAEVSVLTNVPTMNFEGARGLVTPAGHFDVNQTSGPAIRHIVSMAGRIRSCSPDGEAKQLVRC